MTLAEALEAAINGTATRADVIAAIDAELERSASPQTKPERYNAMKYTCPTCNHDAIHHFVLGTKCSVEGCNCMRSQSEVVNGAIAARISALEADKAKLIAALESTDALIEEDMGEWYGIQFAYLPVDYANRAHIRDAIAAVLAKVTK